MSQPMNKAKDTVGKIINKNSDTSLLEQLKTIDKLITQNEAKIWLRTRSGKPMAEKMETTASMVLQKQEEGADLAEPINMLMSVAKEIDEESQRRSMVVT